MRTNKSSVTWLEYDNLQKKSHSLSIEQYSNYKIKWEKEIQFPKAIKMTHTK